MELTCLLILAWFSSTYIVYCLRLRLQEVPNNRAHCFACDRLEFLCSHGTNDVNFVLYNILFESFIVDITANLHTTQ